jgi:DNA primase
VPPTRYGDRKMPRIPEETVEQILAATDIVDLVSSYFPLKRAGSTFRALCPFHNEKTPSFYVNPGRQSYKCFGCQESGSAVGFVMAYENMPFPEAIRKLADKAGIPIVEEAYNPDADRLRRSRGRLLEVHKGATEFMHSLLMKDPAAQHGRDYLKSRGFDGEMAKRWALGWMPEDGRVFLDWARRAGFSGRELKDSGLANLKEENNARSGLYVRFRDRLMFPVRDDLGNVIAFSGRQLREDPRSGKYVNSPETPIFTKSKVIFGLDQARRAMAKEHCGLICEGQIDAIACHESGIQNAVAPLGTAFTTDHARILKRYTDNITLCYDSDKAGHAAVAKSFRELAPQNLNVRVISLPEGEDPDTFIKKFGVDAFRKLMDEAAEFFDYVITHERKTRDLNQSSQLADLAREMASLISVLTDHVSKDTAINHVATRLGIGTNEFREAVSKAAQRPTRRWERKSEDTPQSITPTTLHPSVAALCRHALQTPEVQEWLCEQTESLMDAVEGRDGAGILLEILAKRPDPSSLPAVNAFLMTLTSPDQAAIHPLLEEPPAADPLEDAADLLGVLSLQALERRIAATEARLRAPNLSPTEMTALFQEIKELQSLIAAAKNS